MMSNKTNLTIGQVRAIYFLTSLFLFALSFYAFFQIKTLIESSEWMDHTNQVNLSLEHISISFLDATTVQKSYLMTGDTAMLTRREADFTKIYRDLDTVDNLTSDNKDQHASLESLRVSIADKIESLRSMAKEFPPLQITPEFETGLNQGFNQTQDVMQQIHKMSATENELLEIRKQKYSRFSSITPPTIIILSMGALLILFVSYLRMNGALRLSEELQNALNASKVELERKNAELLKTSEQFLKIFDNNPVAMTFGIIGSSKIVYANNLFYSWFGYTKEEVIGHTTEDLHLVSDEENARLLPIILAHLEEERPVEELKALPPDEMAELLLKLREKIFATGFEVLYSRKNGETFNAVVYFEIIDIGGVKYALTSYLDITERKEMQVQLENQKAYAELVIESNPAMVMALDQNLEVNVWNKKCEEHSKLTKAEVLGRHLFDVFPEYNNTEWVRYLNQVIKNGETLHFPKAEFKHVKGFGESWLVPLRERTQQIIGMLIITRDITQTVEMTWVLEQKNKELEKVNRILIETAATLRKSEERYHRMIAQVKDYAIILLSSEGNIENWNEGSEKIKGYKAAEIIGKHFSLFYTEEDKKNDLPQKLLVEASKAGNAVHEGWRLRKDGSKFWGSTVITAIHDDKNNIIGFSKVTRDLTDKKIAEARIMEANEILEQKNVELQRINKELESFNYISSHDLQEPLRQIQIFASRFSEDELEHLSEAGKTYFQKMNNAAKRMQNLITDLLAYSRTKTETRKFKTINFDLLISEVKEEFAETIEEKHAVIESEKLGELQVIPFQFRQLIHNLIGNALKFSRPETPPHIIIKNEKISADHVPDLDHAVDATYYHITVSDNGIGFEQQYKDRIFDVFQRVHDSQKIAGTGMGLAIAKTIAENHNGIIKATGDLNKGATFDIYIPVTQKE